MIDYEVQKRQELEVKAADLVEADKPNIEGACQAGSVEFDTKFLIPWTTRPVVSRLYRFCGLAKEGNLCVVLNPPLVDQVDTNLVVRKMYYRFTMTLTPQGDEVPDTIRWLYTLILMDDAYPRLVATETDLIYPNGNVDSLLAYDGRATLNTLTTFDRVLKNGKRVN